MGLLGWLWRKLSGRGTRSGRLNRAYEASATSNQGVRNTSVSDDQASYERGRLYAEQGNFVEALRELSSCHHSKAKELLERAWCPHCNRRVSQPSFTRSTVDYARFWRGVCPSCTGKLQFKGNGIAPCRQRGSSKNGFEKLTEQVVGQLGREAVLHRAVFRSNAKAYDCLADFSFYDKQCGTCPLNMWVAVVEYDDGFTLVIAGRLTREQNREVMTKWQALGRAGIENHSGLLVTNEGSVVASDYTAALADVIASGRSCWSEKRGRWGLP